MRKTLIDKLWRGKDPFDSFGAGDVDIQGWSGSDHPWFAETIRELQPRLIVEVGVWKGASVMHMADALWRASVDDYGQPVSDTGVILAVDTFQGSAEHWLGEHRVPMRNGRPVLYDQFARNVVAADAQDYVVPLPIDSINAAMVLTDLGVSVDMIHLDAAHDAMSVSMDLQAWWPLLRSGGVLIGDDYDPAFPGVVMAFDAFAERQGVLLECSAPKVRLRKP